MVSRQAVRCLDEKNATNVNDIDNMIMLHIGPNVFVDSTGEDGNNDTGPHERWAMGILYDNITCNTINVRQRSWMGSGQGWAGKHSSSNFVLRDLLDFVPFRFTCAN